VTVAQRRRAVDHLKDRRVSERRACRLTVYSRSAAWYPLKGSDDAELQTLISEPNIGARVCHLADFKLFCHLTLR